LISLDQREQRVIELRDDLGLWLLRQHLQADPDASAPATAGCPRCGKDAQPRPVADGRAPRPDHPRRATHRATPRLLVSDLPGRLFPPWTSSGAWALRATAPPSFAWPSASSPAPPPSWTPATTCANWPNWP